MGGDLETTPKPQALTDEQIVEQNNVLLEELQPQLPGSLESICESLEKMGISCEDTIKVMVNNNNDE